MATTVMEILARTVRKARMARVAKATAVVVKDKATAVVILMTKHLICHQMH